MVNITIEVNGVVRKYEFSNKDKVIYTDFNDEISDMVDTLEKAIQPL